MKSRLAILLLSFFAMLSSCTANSANKDYFLVHFDPCVEKETNYIEDQKVKPGEQIYEPTVVFPFNLDETIKVSGWYLEKSYKTKWNFANPVQSNMTLYAKWADVITINYYLKDSTSPIWVVNDALSGEPLQRHDELCDGYEFYGYFTDPACHEPFDLNKPLYEDVDVYLYRGDTLSLNARSIKRRFSMMAAGGSGSTVGNISNVLLDSSGIECVDVNFGYSTSADPYMLISNPQIDISHSQKIKIKFKNFGGATNIAFYWVSKYADGTYASNTVVDTEANSAHFRLNSFECHMSEDDPWLEKEFDLAKSIHNGVSPWANSVTLVHLRIQFGYISRTKSDLSNVIRIASITSTPDDTYKGFNDTKQINDLLVNDDEESLNNASNAQEQNRGVIFPKNNNLITEDSTTYYKKTNGLLLYSPYGADVRRYFFDVSSQNINAEDYSYVTLSLCNLSYISDITFYVSTITPNGLTRNTVSAVSLPIRMKGFDDISINLYGKANMVGTVKSFSILFNYNGVDNAIILKSITLSKARAYQIPGFNFDDILMAGFTSNEDVSLTYNRQLLATSFTSTKDSGVIDYDLPYQFDMTPYRMIRLRYLLKDNNVTSLVIRLKIDNVYTDYEFNNLTISNELVDASLLLEKTGILQSIQIVINGQGTIDISSIEFVLDEATSCDLSLLEIYGTMLNDWAYGCSYVEDKRATNYKGGANPFRYYFGFLNKEGKRAYPNIPLENKSYVYIIYQNPKSDGNPMLNVFATNIDTDPDYLIAISERNPIISSPVNMAYNMGENDWLTVAIPIPSIYTNGKYYLSNFSFGIPDQSNVSLYIRGVAVI